MTNNNELPDIYDILMTLQAHLLIPDLMSCQGDVEVMIRRAIEVTNISDAIANLTVGHKAELNRRLKAMAFRTQEWTKIHTDLMKLAERKIS